MARTLHPADIAVALLAEEQDQYFSRSQARAAGATTSLIARRLASGQWVAHARDVFSHRGVAPTPRGAVRIALLDMGDPVTTGVETAAALHRVENFELSPPKLIVPHGTHRRSPGATIHQTRLWPELQVVQGMPATSVLRTLLDLAAVVDVLRLGRVIDELVVRRLVTLAELARGCAWNQRHRRPGAVTLARALDGRTHGYIPSRSELERVLDAIISTIPGVIAQKEVWLSGRHEEPHRVDRLFDNPPLIIEGDGRLWHARLGQMDKDRRRDRHALTLGYPTARYGWWELTNEARAVRAEIIALLSAGEARRPTAVG